MDFDSIVIRSCNVLAGLALATMAGLVLANLMFRVFEVIK